MSKIYKLHKIENGYSVRHVDQNKDIQTFLGVKAYTRAKALKDALEAKANGK